MDMHVATAIFFGLVAISIHELAHVWAVYYLGGQVEWVRLCPLGYVAKLNGVDQLPRQDRYLIYGAGALGNLIFALWLVGVSLLSYRGLPVFMTMAFYHGVLFVFNLLPVLPLDGGRLLFLFLSRRIGFLRASQVLCLLGKIIPTILIVLGLAQLVLFPFNITLFCAGIYIKKQNQHVKEKLHMDFYVMLENKLNHKAPRTRAVKKVHISGLTQIKDALYHLGPDYRVEFLLNETNEPLAERELIRHLFASPKNKLAK